MYEKCPLGEYCPAWEDCRGKWKGCCDDKIEEYFKKQGKIVFRSGRSVMVVEPTTYKNRWGVEYQALKIDVHGDPDSGLYDVDTVILIGARGGCYDILLNDLPLHSVFDNVGKEHEVAVHLMKLHTKISIELSVTDQSEFRRRKLKEAMYLIQRLAEIVKTCFSDERIRNSIMLDVIIGWKGFEKVNGGR